MAKHWYILQVFTNFENKVKESIEIKLKKSKIGHLIGDVKIPEENVVEIKKGKKRTYRKKFLPGYLLVELDIPEKPSEWRNLISKVININGVSGFLGTISKTMKPHPVPMKDIKAIFEKMGEVRGADIVVSKIDMALGEHVKIKDGDFQNFSGIIEEILHEKGKFKVKVEIFGKSTLVELDFSKVEKIS